MCFPERQQRISPATSPKTNLFLPMFSYSRSLLSSAFSSALLLSNVIVSWMDHPCHLAKSSKFLLGSIQDVHKIKPAYQATFTGFFYFSSAPKAQLSALVFFAWKRCFFSSVALHKGGSASHGSLPVVTFPLCSDEYFVLHRDTTPLVLQVFTFPFSHSFCMKKIILDIPLYIFDNIHIPRMV